MSIASGWTHGGLLQTAGIAPASYGDDIYFAAEEMLEVVPTVDAQTIEPGEDLFIPKLGQETVQTHYAKTTADGSTFTKSTDNQGSQITFAAIDDTAVQMVEKFQYVGMAHSRVAWNRMPQSRRLAYLNGRKMMASKALQRSKDASILSLALPGLHLAANQLNSTTPADITMNDVYTIIQKFREASWREDIFGWLHPSQIPALMAQGEKFFNYSTTGVAGGAPRDLTFTFANLTIKFHPDVYSDGADGYHGLFYAAGPMSSIGYREVGTVTVDDWYDGDTKSYKTSPDTDYAYALVDNTLALTLQTPSS